MKCKRIADRLCSCMRFYQEEELVWDLCVPSQAMYKTLGQRGQDSFHLYGWSVATKTHGCWRSTCEHCTYSK